MSKGLPLNVLGLIAPILCWVEGGDETVAPGGAARDGDHFKEQVRPWLVKQLPTYSFDTLDEIIELAFDHREPGDFISPGSGARKSSYTPHTPAPPENFYLTHIFEKLAAHYFEWRSNNLCIKPGRMVELHELAMRFPIQHLIRFLHADAAVRGYISMTRALELPVAVGKLYTSYQGLGTVVSRGLSEGHLHLYGVIGTEETWADHLLKRDSSRERGCKNKDMDYFLVLARNALRLLALGLLYVEAGDVCQADLPFDLLPQLDSLYAARNHSHDPRLRDRMLQQWDNEFMKEFNPVKQEGSRWRNRLTRVPWRQKTELFWLLELANPGMVRVWFRDLSRIYRDKTVTPRGIRDRISLLNRLHFKVQEFLTAKIRCFGRERQDTCQAQSTVPGQGIGSSPAVEFMNQAFTRYVIYHTHYWQQANQQGNTTGLRRFQSFYDAPERWLRGEESGELEGLTVERLSQSRALKQVEGRLTPPSRGAAKYIPWLLAFSPRTGKHALDKFGIVIHFKKDSHENSARKNRDTAHKFAGRAFALRHGKVRRQTREDAFSLFRLLSSPHPVVPFIVGIDAASLELTTPPEVFAPAFRFLREYPIEIRRRFTAREDFEKHDIIADLVNKRRLDMTYHVGEDFRHLLSGLRAIHEVIEFLKPLPGDRLGHAIALGLAPETWLKQIGYQAVMPRQEWLDTLVWVHNLLGAGDNLVGELGIEEMIQFHSKHIYGKREEVDIADAQTRIKQFIKRDIELYCTPTTLYDSWRLRQMDPHSLENGRFIDGWNLANDRFKIRSPGESPWCRRWADVQQKVLDEVNENVGADAAYLLTKLYWYCPRVRQEGGKTVTLDMLAQKKKWLLLFSRVQEKILGIVHDRHLVVETNPTSNRVIGPMAAMDEHPVFRLNFDREGDVAGKVRVTINTDDPGIFATSLSHEFFLLGEALLDRGVPEAEVMAWLERLRQNGMDYSFLRVLPGPGDSRIQSILERLAMRYEPLMRRVKGEQKQYRPLESRIKTGTKLNALQIKYKKLEARYNQLENRLLKLEDKG